MVNHPSGWLLLLLLLTMHWFQYHLTFNNVAACRGTLQSVQFTRRYWVSEMWIESGMFSVVVGGTSAATLRRWSSTEGRSMLCAVAECCAPSWCKYRDQRVCVSVRVLSATTRPNFNQFLCVLPAVYNSGSVHLRRRCDMIYASGFMDDVMFASGQK